MLENIYTIQTVSAENYDQLVEECSKNIDEVKMAKVTSDEHENEHENVCKCSCTLYIILFYVFLTISIYIGSLFIYFN